MIAVQYVSHMGSDLDVVNAARVSFDKESQWEVLGYSETYDDYGNVDSRKPIKRLRHDDVKLITYLAKHKHWSPFSHCFLKFRIKAPIFVARQLAKHQVGLAWNEVSRRYVSSDPEFYMPKTWRKKHESAKQGSSDEAVDLNPMYSMEDKNGVVLLPEELVEDCLTTYKSMLQLGVCPEQARMLLPQNAFTEWVWSGSLYAFARIVSLRTHTTAQQETREVAEQIAKHCEVYFPVSWNALKEHGHG